MYKIIFFLIISLNLFRYFFISRPDKLNYLLASIYVQTIPFFITIPLTDLMSGGSGSLGSALLLAPPHVLGLMFFLKNRMSRYKVIDFSPLERIVLFTTILFCSIALFNPANQFRFGAIITAFFFLGQLLVLRELRIACKDRESTFFEGIYDGLKIMTAIQLFLSILYPLLGFTFAASIFYSFGTETALRRSPSAIGTFTHPGSLALFSTMAGIFFLNSFLSGFRKHLSAIFSVISIFIVILTQSRTALITILFAYGCTIVLHDLTKTGVRRKKSYAVYGAAVAVVIGIILSPARNMFINSNTDQMTEARFSHYILAWAMIQDHPIIGVGLNAHLTYAKEYYSEFVRFLGNRSDDFYFKNPIHNIHIVVLTETGILGFSLWVIAIIRGWLSRIRSIKSTHSQTVKVLSGTLAVALLAFCIYGMTGWAPLTYPHLSMILLFLFASSVPIPHNNASPLLSMELPSFIHPANLFRSSPGTKTP